MRGCRGRRTWSLLLLGPGQGVPGGVTFASTVTGPAWRNVRVSGMVAPGVIRAGPVRAMSLPNGLRGECCVRGDRQAPQDASGAGRAAVVLDELDAPGARRGDRQELICAAEVHQSQANRARKVWSLRARAAANTTWSRGGAAPAFPMIFIRIGPSWVRVRGG